MSRSIMILAGLGLALSGYFIFFRDRDDLVALFAICLLLVVIAYTYQYQIDQLMIRGVPQKLDPAMRDMFLQTSPWFARLSPPQQQLMEDRIQRWVLKKDFINKGEEKAPEDVKYILAFYANLLTLNQSSYMYEHLDRIVFYYHPFLTPAHPDDVHIAEGEWEDGTLIISVPHLIKGHLEKGYYNIALHLMAEAYQRIYLKKKMNWNDDAWTDLETYSAIPKSSIEAYIGLPLQDPWPVAVHHQYVYTGPGIRNVTDEFPQLQN